MLLGIEAGLGQQAPWITIVQKSTTVADLLAGPGRRAEIVLLGLQLTDPDDDDSTRNVRRIRAVGAKVRAGHLQRIGPRPGSGRAPHPQLSQREREVFDLLAQGVGRTEIGRILVPPVTVHAVDACVRRVAERYRQLGRYKIEAITSKSG